MNYPCDVIKDVLPLYYDHACSEQTRQMVEDHLSECEPCRRLMEKMGNTAYNDRLEKERETVMGHYTRSMRRKLLLAGLCLFVVPLLTCFIVNLAVGHTLDWFFIVLTALLVFASLTAVPVIAPEKKGLWAIGSFTVSLMALLLTCALYSGGDWFFVTAIPVLFGLSLVFLPFILGQLPQKGAASRHKGLIAMTADTILLYAVILVCGLYADVAGYFRTALPITTVTVLFAWALFVIIRYGRGSGWIKAGLCCILGGVFLSQIQDIIDWILEGVWHVSITEANLFSWGTDMRINANCYLLILLTGIAVGLILLAVGWTRGRSKRTTLTK